MNDIAIQTENLTRDFETVRAVDNLNIKVPSGDVFGFLGPNGAGKTTTIRLLLGLLKPTNGNANVLGFDTQTQADEVRNLTGALLEHTGIYEKLTAQENLEFYGRIWHLSHNKRNNRIKELLTNLSLWERRNEKAGTWSHGMKKKLAVARSLLHRPTLVFMDEPTAGLDPIASAALREDLATLADSEGVTIFLTTHNLTEAEKLCDQVAVINEGKLLTVGSPDELRTKVDKPQIEIIGRGFNEKIINLLRAREEVSNIKIRNNHLLIELVKDVDTSPIVKLLVSEKVEIEEVHKGKATLEDVFLTLIKEEEK